MQLGACVIEPFVISQGVLTPGLLNSTPQHTPSSHCVTLSSLISFPRVATPKDLTCRHIVSTGNVQEMGKRLLQYLSLFLKKTLPDIQAGPHVPYLYHLELISTTQIANLSIG